MTFAAGPPPWDGPVTLQDLQRIAKEVERFEDKYGIRPSRIECGSEVRAKLEAMRARSEAAPKPLSCIPIVARHDLAPDEWAPVYRARR